MVIKLYKAGFIAGNRGDRFPPGSVPKVGLHIGNIIPVWAPSLYEKHVGILWGSWAINPHLIHT